MDPLEELNAEIIEEIFQYLTAKELLESSLVSQSWYDFIADSNICMKRLKIKISKDCVNDGIEYLKKSKRNYENLMLKEVVDPIRFNDALQILSQPERQFKNIEMQVIRFPTQTTFHNLMQTIQNSVEVLHLEQLILCDNDLLSSAQSYCCPKLKNLTLISCQINEFFIISNNLTTLNIISNYGLVNATVVDNFQNLLCINNHLHTLTLSGNIITQIFCDDITDKIHFKLNEFKVTNFNVDKFHNRSTIEKNFNLFLKTQPNIKKIFIGEWLGTTVLETVFNEMKSLNDLTIMELAKANPLIPFGRNELEGPEIVRTNVSNLKSNPSIIKLDYQDICGNIFTMKSLLEAAPNLRSFSTYSMNQEMLQMLATKMSNLEYLSVSFFDAGDIVYHPIFLKLQVFASLRLEEELIQSITLKEPENRNHFEKVIFECFIDRNTASFNLISSHTL